MRPGKLGLDKSVTVWTGSVTIGPYRGTEVRSADLSFFVGCETWEVGAGQKCNRLDGKRNIFGAENFWINFVNFVVTKMLRSPS